MLLWIFLDFLADPHVVVTVAMRTGMRVSGLSPKPLSARRWWPKLGGALLILGAFIALCSPSECRAFAQGVEVRNLGLSRLGGRTMLTVILDRAANPTVSPYTGVDRAQVVVDFSKARAGKLPEGLAGDDVLVKKVRTEVSEAGVKIILEMFPERPYIMKREIRPLSGGLAMFRLGLEADPSGTPVKEPPASAMPAPQEPLAPPEPKSQDRATQQAPATSSEEQTPGEPAPVAPTPQEPVAPPATLAAPTGTFAELYQLMPQAKGLLDFLRGEGWTVAQARSYDRPGKRFSRGFHLTNSRYPELQVKIAHLPPNAPAAPSINIIDLSMDNLLGQAPDEYRNLRQWNFGKIKTKYEDIGDFFDEALKPLRVEIRKKCQELALRYSHFIVNFLRQVVPGNPQLADKAITLIRKKVNPRFEGVQYTLSDNPLIMLNLVDFLYVRVYYIQ
jgi:hypothetical protein